MPVLNGHHMLFLHASSAVINQKDEFEIGFLWIFCEMSIIVV